MAKGGGGRCMNAVCSLMLFVLGGGGHYVWARHLAVDVQISEEGWFVFLFHLVCSGQAVQLLRDLVGNVMSCISLDPARNLV